MLTLKQLSVKKICENIHRLSVFIYFSPLPWSLTEEVMRNFGKYKWKQLQDVAESTSDFAISLLYDFEFETDIKPELRNALLSVNDYEFFTHYNAYCSWTSYYEIKRYNLILCQPCFKIFKEILHNRKIKFSFSFQYFHESYLSYELSNLYHKQSCWCHNEFNEILFELKDKLECIDNFHSSNGSLNFQTYEMSNLSGSDEEEEHDDYTPKKRIRLISLNSSLKH